jgi:hypothetical protein
MCHYRSATRPYRLQAAKARAEKARLELISYLEDRPHYDVDDDDYRDLLAALRDADEEVQEFAGSHVVALAGRAE